ncbi:MAG: hypothetical protein ABGY96_18880, partial [bacterium]
MAEFYNSIYWNNQLLMIGILTSTGIRETLQMLTGWRSTMGHQFAQIAFTDTVRDIQTAMGSRA